MTATTERALKCLQNERANAERDNDHVAAKSLDAAIRVLIGLDIAVPKERAYLTA